MNYVFLGQTIEIINNDLLQLENILSGISFEYSNHEASNEAIVKLNGSIHSIRNHLQAVYMESLTSTSTFHNLSNRSRNLLSILKLLEEHLETLTRSRDLLQTQHYSMQLLKTLNIWKKVFKIFTRIYISKR